MQIPDPLGVPGAPSDTLAAVVGHFPGGIPQGGHLILVTGRQGERAVAGYAAVIVPVGEAEATVSAPAFGPRYGVGGVRALTELVRWAGAQGLGVRETVLNPSDFGRVLAEPDEAEVRRLIAASNPSDPAIYTVQVPEPEPEEDEGG